MYPITDRFKQAVMYSHTVVTRIDIFVNDKIITLPLITEGQVTEDVDQAVRRQTTVTATDVDGSVTPADARSMLAPFGNEFQCFTGIEFPDGTVEWILLGTFGIEECEIIDSGANLQINLSGDDRSTAVSRNKFRDTYASGSGANIVDVIAGILDFIGVSFPMNLTATNDATTAQVVYNIGDDPWTAIQNLAASAGCEVLFDVDGTLLLRPLRDYTNAEPDWEIVEGDGTFGVGSLTAVNRQMKRTDDLANWIVVTGQSADNRSTIPQGEAYDNDPNSPTYVYGKYGIVTKHISDSSLTSDLACTVSAEHYLEQNLGRFEEIQTWFLPFPFLQCEDLVHAKRELVKLDANLQLDQVSHPLVAARGSQAVTRKRSI